jgi:DNA-binding transcriptional regulator LsrR (DeoR family)
MFDRLPVSLENYVALVGIGSIEPSSLVASSGNVFDRTKKFRLRRGGYLSEFYDANGREVRDPVGNR